MVDQVFVAEDKETKLCFDFDSIDQAVEFVILNLKDGREMFEVFSALKIKDEYFNKKSMIRRA